MSLLRKWLGEAGVKLKNDSAYFHADCAPKAQAKLNEARATSGPAERESAR